MQLVAASKMKVFQRKSVSVRAYTLRLLESLRLCGASLPETPWAQERKEGKVLFVLLTSDKGLCGAMNGKLIRTLGRSEEWKGLSNDQRELVAVGKKSMEAARTEGVEPIATFPGLQEELTPLEALKVIDVILTRWLSGEVKRVVLIAPEYVNPFVFEVHTRTYLPLTTDLALERLHGELKERDDLAPEAALFEPSQEEAVARIAEQVVQSLFTEAFYELKATEYSSRMVAMKKATEAADDRIKQLTNVYNKARQGAITQELSELAAANEAMSSQDVYEITQV